MSMLILLAWRSKAEFSIKSPQRWSSCLWIKQSLLSLSSHLDLRREEHAGKMNCVQENRITICLLLCHYFHYTLLLLDLRQSLPFPSVSDGKQNSKIFSSFWKLFLIFFKKLHYLIESWNNPSKKLNYCLRKENKLFPFN